MYSRPFQSIQVHIADIHFGAIDPDQQYMILYEQFLKPIENLPFDILAIDGDLFDRKFVASSRAVEMAIKFVNKCAMLCEEKQATLILISGTESHEAGQLSLFRDLGNSVFIDCVVVERAMFVYSHGLKILCIPEEYGKGYDYYAPLLNQVYDCVFMHGTIAGGVYGCNAEDLNARRPVFDIQSFAGCKGPIISGHVHEAMCLKDYMYYVSNPIRYKFGEEKPKGYGILVMSDKGHYYQFMPITSFDYNTVTVQSANPDNIDGTIQYIESLKAATNGKLRVKLEGLSDMASKAVNQYFQQQSSDIKIEMQRQEKDSQPAINTTDDILQKYSGMDYLMDPNLSSFNKLGRYINESVGYNFISEDELKNIYEGK